MYLHSASYTVFQGKELPHYDAFVLYGETEEQFVLEGGDLTWITIGVAKVDPRLARFSELNEIMAFRPWSITTNHL